MGGTGGVRFGVTVVLSPVFHAPHVDRTGVRGYPRSVRQWGITAGGSVSMETAIALAPVSNDAADDVAINEPYTVAVTIRGSSAILFHRWSNEAVAEKAAAAKGSKAKKSDNLESYVYRGENGNLALPGEYLRQSVIGAAKFRQDPRSPRKSAMDLFKAGVVAITDMADLGVKDPDYIDRRRVLIQRNAITRERPALREGWQATIELMVLLPEYIDRTTLIEVIGSAGRLIGVGDFRPTYGRFAVVSFS
jgi:hypothetical protein